MITNLHSSLISIVIPVFNESANISELIEKIIKAPIEKSYEILVVNDGSTDETAVRLHELSAKYPSLRPLSLKQNFGQTAALAAGIDAALGQIVVTLDGDGQNDPADIPQLLKKMDEGFDVVSGWRQNRQDNFLTRKVPSWAANWLISIVSGVFLHDYGCTLKAYRKSIISNLQLAGEMHRFLPAWCAWQGAKIAEIPVQHHARKFGKSKYGLLRIVKVIIDLATLKFFSGYLFKPNYLFSGTALVFLAVSIVSAGWAVFDKFGPDLYPKYRIPFLMLAGFSLIVSVLLALMGLIAELLVRIYFQILQQKPYKLKNE